MPQVQVGLDKNLDGQRTTPSIVTRIHPLGRRSKTGPLTVIIPAGRQSFATFDIPVGRYLFEAYLPSGETVTKTVEITSRGEQTIQLRATDSPHEWLSWQHLAARRSAVRGTAPPRTKAARAKAPRATADNLLDLVTLEAPVAATLLGIWRGASLDTLAPAVVNVPPRPGATRPEHDSALGVSAYLYRDGPWQRQSPWEDSPRYYGLVRRPPSGPPLLAAVPLPWHQADMSGNAAVDVLVDVTPSEGMAGQAWPVTVSVVVRDNVMGPVFGYLASGDLPNAAQVVETAVDRLAAKYLNALAAAGAAYILVRSATGRSRGQPPVWVAWLGNLRNDFPSLPDGSILAGWAQLNGIGHETDASRAAAAFVEAVDRGLPLYTAGVRLLFDGMTRVASLPKTKRPAGFDDAFEIVRRLALRIDVGQTFTVVRLG